MRKLILITALLFAVLENFAQASNFDDQWTYFEYIEGKGVGNNLKIILISKYVLRFNNKGVKALQARMAEAKNDFAKQVTERVRMNEDLMSNVYYDLRFDVPNIVSINDYRTWAVTSTESFWNARNENKDLMSNAEPIRDAFIKDREQKGYLIYQVDFTPDTAHYYRPYQQIGENKYAYVNGESSRHFPLSPLWIKEYNKGDIRRELDKLKKESSSLGSSGLTVESDRQNSSSNSSSTGSSSEKSSQNKSGYEELSDVCAREMSYVTIMYNSAKQPGNSSSPGEWDKVIQGCEEFFSLCGSNNYFVNQIYADAKKRKEDINEAAINALSSFATTMATEVFTKYTMYGFSYTGLEFNSAKYSNQQYQKIAFQITGIRKYANILAEIAYAQSPNYVVKINDANGQNYALDTIRRTGGMFNFGFGPNFRLFHNRMHVYADVVNTGFFYKKNFSDEQGMDWILGFSGGVTIRLGKIGVGAVYEYGLNLLKSKVGSELEWFPSSFKTKAELVQPYKMWNGLGLRLTFNFKTGTSR